VRVLLDINIFLDVAFPTPRGAGFVRIDRGLWQAA
jgi:hypothetical protein